MIIFFYEHTNADENTNKKKLKKLKSDKIITQNFNL